MNNLKPFCIQISAENEWNAFKEIIGKPDTEFRSSPFGKYIIVTVENRTCIFYHSGASKTLAAAACQYAIDHWKPEIIFVLGTAGGVADNLKPLDLVIANKTVQYDCISRMGSDSELFYKEFDTDNLLIDFGKPSFHFHEGTIATADQDIDFRIREILRPHGILAADWESGAIAPICKLNEVPCCIIRGISDVPEFKPGGAADSQFDDFKINTPLIMKNLIVDVLPELIRMRCKNS